MKKKLLKNISEYRKWAWKISEQSEGKADEALGLLIDLDCWDYNENNEPIDEQGNVILDETAETVKLEEWVEKLKFPVIAVYWVEKTFDRCGNVAIVAVEFVSQSDFK